MKYLITTIAVITITLFFAQCKKGKTPAPPVANDDKLIEKGKYIIRTKYFCNGGCFVFRSVSNYETISWEWTTKENLESIKEDADPFNSYVWDIAKTGAIGDALFVYTDPSSPDGWSERLINPLNYYTIYQQKPDGFFHYLPNSPLPLNNSPDEAETGGRSKYVAMVSTNVSPVSDDFNHDLGRIFIRESTDSTHRFILTSNGGWSTFFSLLTDPRDSHCEPGNVNPRPAWTGSWLCPNTASVSNSWGVDACYTSQVVLEKVD